MNRKIERVGRLMYEEMVRRTLRADNPAVDGDDLHPGIRAFLRGDWDAQPERLKDDWRECARIALSE